MITSECIKEGYEYGIQWKLTFGFGSASVNGYVKLPSDHELIKTEFTYSYEYDAPGGLTYSDEEGWIGFDTAHHDDYWPPAELAKFGGTPLPSYLNISSDTPIRIWTLELVQQAVENLAQQVSGFKDLQDD